MSGIDEIVRYLHAYDGKPVKVMEVCGTHTAAIFRAGIRDLISPKIRLVSGPGCPVCLACEAYIDKLVERSLQKDTVVLSFGDLFKVKGSNGSLSDAKANGGSVELVYSPMDALKLAKENPQKNVVMAAVGFETTAPLYALLVKSYMEQGIGNVKLLTGLKLLPPALAILCAEDIDAFLAPGHVASVIGSGAFEPISEQYQKPFAVSGFTSEHILAALYWLVRQIETGTYGVHNAYGEAVRTNGNEKALAMIAEYFEPGAAYWRGLSEIDGSGLYLKADYQRFDAGSLGLKDTETESANACRCPDVLTGRIDPADCPLFATVCTPQDAYGPCMVSAEGACGIWYREGLVW